MQTPSIQSIELNSDDLGILYSAKTAKINYHLNVNEVFIVCKLDFMAFQFVIVLNGSLPSTISSLMAVTEGN